MALNAPQAIEVEQIQFKIHDKFQIFEQTNLLRNYVNLLATSSQYGLVFVGNPNTSELKVVQLKTIVEARETDGKLLVRNFQLPSIPNCISVIYTNCIAVNCDGRFLAVNFTLNGGGFLTVFNVQSFYSSNITQKFSVKISAEDNVKVIQCLWNPIMSNTLALILSDGSAGMYNFKDENYDFHSLDKSNQVFCGCWSPKGKQIVFGFQNGKIIQFKPDLKPARVIECPPNIIEGSFKTIAIEWLSTYQFAVSFLQDGQDMTPSLFIVNAPKTGHTMYINYYDICYSSSGPRIPQVFFIHLQEWNLLLVANSNSMEVGLLGNSGTGEPVIWTEYNLNDSCRLNLPMTKDKQETHPIGFCLETGTTHNLVIGENEIPVMPMVHILSTHGQIISFDFLNLINNIPGICCPPVSIADMSGLNDFREFVQNSDLKNQNQQDETSSLGILNDNSTNVQSFGGFTSTPAKSNIFGSPQNIISTPQNIPQSQPISGLSFTGTPQTFFGISAGSTNNSQGSVFGNTPQGSVFGNTSHTSSVDAFGNGNALGGATEQQKLFNKGNAENQNNSNVGFGNLTVVSGAAKGDGQKNLTINPIVDQEKNKPLYTINAKFTPPNIEQTKDEKLDTRNLTFNSVEKLNFKDPVNYDYIHEMIATEIQCFELELNELSSKSKDLNISIGNIETVRNYTKKIDELNEIMLKAQENDFDSDIQTLRHSVTECFSMIAEVRSKLEFFENPELSKIILMPSNDQTSRRQLARLNSVLATNEAQLKIIKQQIDANWSDFQDLMNRNTSSRMHIPSLEGIYQTMTKQKNILAKERQKILKIKSKLNFPGIQLKNITNKREINADSLADSILSMSLAEQILKENSKLNKEKLEAIRNNLNNRKILNIIPQRPDRLQSEVILKSKIKQKKSEPKMKQENLVPTTTTTISNNFNIMTSSAEKENSKQQIEAPQSNSIKPIFSPAPISFGLPLSTKTNENKGGIHSFGNVNVNLVNQAVCTNNNQNSISNALLTTSSQPTSQNQTNISSVAYPKAFENSENLSKGANTEPPTIFGNLASSLAPNLNFSNFGSKNSFTPVSSIPSFGGGTSGLSFNVKSTSPSQDIQKTQISQRTSAQPASNLTFSSPQINSNPKLGTMFSTEAKTNISISSETVLKPTISFTNKNKEADSSETFVENLNICKPNTAVATSASNLNIFGTGIFSQGSPSFTANSTLASNESKTNFLSTFSSSSKSNLFGSTPVVSASNSFISPTETSSFIFSENTSSSSNTLTSSSSIPNKSIFTSIATLAPTANIESSKTSLFGITKSPAVFNLGLTDNAKPLSITNSKETTSSTLQTDESEIVSPNPVSVGKAINDNLSTNTTSSIFGNLTMNSATPTVHQTSNQVIDILTDSSLTTKPGSNCEEDSNNQVKTSSIFGTSNVVLNTPEIINATNTTLKPSSTIDSVFSLNTSNSNTPAYTFNISSTNTPAFSLNTSNTTTSAFSLSISTTTSSAFSSNTSTITSAAFSSNTPKTSAPAITSSTSPASTFSFSSWGLGTSSFSSPGIASNTTTSSSSDGSLFTASLGNPSSTGNALTSTLSSATPPKFFGTSPQVNTTANLQTTSASSNFTDSTSVNSTSTAEQVTTTTNSITGNIFGGIPKPDQSVFGQTSPKAFGNIFSQAAQPTQFTQQPTSPATSPSIFGGGSSGSFAALSQNTPFGATANTGSLFGGTVEKASSGQNIFASTNSSSINSGSIFGQSPFNLNQNNDDQSNSANIFGGPTSGNVSFGSSIFGGGMTNNAEATSTSAFGGGGSFSNLSGATTTNFGGFGGNTAQMAPTVGFGGAPVSQTAFGSPNTSLAKPTFGGPPSFGSPTSFGNSPTFGGAPTFGAGAKGFGTFSSPTNTTPTNNIFASPTQKNDYFEALGSSNDSLSFGNLAQNANSNNAKPGFAAGSSFSNWR